jgi:hypothetical protein
VRPASKTLYVAGEVGVAIGLVVGLVGAVALFSYEAGDAVGNAIATDLGQPADLSPPLWTSALYVGGVFVTLAGAVLMLDNATTRVTQVFAGDTPPPVPAPKWKPIHSGSELRLPPVAAWPLISATF